MPSAAFAALSQEVSNRVAKVKAANPNIEHSKAVCQVFAADPALHQKYLEAANAPGAPVATSPFAGAAAVAEFDRRVKAKTDAGVPKHQATRDVFAADPPLHLAYVAARNQRR